MPSTYTQNIGIEKIGAGEQSGSWGDTTNDNFDIIDRAINGSLTLSLSGTSSTLTTSDGVLSDGQYKVLVLTGLPSGTHTITISPNDAQKVYMVQNDTAQSVVFTQGSGGNVTIAAGGSAIIYTNGAGSTAAVSNLVDDFAMSNARITGGSITGITDIAVADGGTGASTAAQARTNLGVTLPNIGVTIPASVINQGPDDDNRIINGAIDFWQRGTSFTSAVYGADRWVNGFSGGSVTMSQQPFALGATLASNNPRFALRQSVSGQVSTNHFAWIEQRIEGVRSYAGQTITILGWAQRVSGAGNMAVELLQDFGTGGSPSTAVAGIGAAQVTLASGVFSPFAVTINVPSVTGKILGSNGNDYLSLRFWTSAGSAYNAQSASLGLQTIGVDLWGIHIKLGTHTTAVVDLYRQRELQPELARCQRYYEVGEASQIYTAMAFRYLYVPFKTPKREIPGVARLGVGPITPGTAGTTVFNPTLHGFYWVQPSSTNAIGGDWAASSEL